MAVVEEEVEEEGVDVDGEPVLTEILDMMLNLIPVYLLSIPAFKTQTLAFPRKTVLSRRTLLEQILT